MIARLKVELACELAELTATNWEAEADRAAAQFLQILGWELDRTRLRNFIRLAGGEAGTRLLPFGGPLWTSAGTQAGIFTLSIERAGK